MDPQRMALIVGALGAAVTVFAMVRQDDLIDRFKVLLAGAVIVGGVCVYLWSMDGPDAELVDPVAAAFATLDEAFATATPDADGALQLSRLLAREGFSVNATPTGEVWAAKQAVSDGSVCVIGYFGPERTSTSGPAVGPGQTCDAAFAAGYLAGPRPGDPAPTTVPAESTTTTATP